MRYGMGSLGNYGLRTSTVTAAGAGSKSYTGAGSFQVPSGKTTLFVAAVGRGQAGVSSPGAGGAAGAGAKCYSNSFAVTPGELLTIVQTTDAEARRGATVLLRAPAGGSAAAGVGTLEGTGGAGDAGGGLQGGGGGGGAGIGTDGTAGSGGTGGAGGIQALFGVTTGRGGDGGAGEAAAPGSSYGGGGGGSTLGAAAGAGGSPVVYLEWA